MSTPQTFVDLIAQRLRSNPAQPFLTAYDDSTGERTELSMTTYVNWVSKTANLFIDELGLDAGDTVLLDLPSHWLVPVFLGAAWTAGLSVTESPAVTHEVVVGGPDALTRPVVADQVVACSLLPFAVRFAEPLPDGVLDYGLLWPGQSDVFLATQPTSPDTVAWVGEDLVVRQGDLLARASRGECEEGTRLLTDVHPAHADGVPAFLAPLAAQGSVVLLHNPTEDSWPARQHDERTTAVLRSH